MNDYEEYYEYVNPSSNEDQNNHTEYCTCSESDENQRFFGGGQFGPGQSSQFQFPGQQSQFPYPGQQQQYPGQQQQYPGQQQQYPGQQQQFPDQQYGPSMGQAPTSPPPSVTPMKTQTPGLKAVDPGAIRGCLYRYTYVWPRYGFPYWFYPTYVGRRSVSGYRWNGFMWHYFGTDLRSIDSFSCY